MVTNNVYNQRVPVIQAVPITEWSKKKARIVTNVVVEADDNNGLTKKSVADCLQTRPIDYRQRLVAVKGRLSDEQLQMIDKALKIISDLK